MSNLAFKVYERNVKENQNRLRKTGQIPGIIYGEFLDETIPVKMCNAELRRMLRKNSSGSIIEVSLEDKKINCVVKEVQKNERHEIIHVDFQYIKPNEVIKMRIPIRFIGQDLLESKRLTLETHNLYIDLQGDVEKIPESIELDASDMKLDDKVFIEDIVIPQDITILSDPKTLLAVVSSQYFN
ncbi:50S ribosomal protein L25 [Clostridium nigeriense]|uniref:50S ribosomal protein L25 n=1 Tax=Clostridium nigeriense TaxID=1805470 RepID=UPI00082E6F28|nr:50S ribosomal protein L25 [Clostridium nigeriense]